MMMELDLSEITNSFSVIIASVILRSNKGALAPSERGIRVLVVGDEGECNEIAGLFDSHAAPS